MRKLKEQGRDMQTLVDDSGIFTEVSRSAQASPSPRWSPSQGPSSRSGNSVDIPRPCPRVSGSLICLMASLSRMLPSSSLSSFWPNHHGPCSLRYTAAATPQTRLVWSRKITSPSDVQQWCAQAPSGKRYANLTKH